MVYTPPCVCTVGGVYASLCVPVGGREAYAPWWVYLRVYRGRHVHPWALSGTITPVSLLGILSVRAGFSTLMSERGSPMGIP